MSPSRHVSFGGFAGGYVDDVVEEVGFAMLTAEILQRVVSILCFKNLLKGSRGGKRGTRRGRKTNPTDDILMVAQMSLAVLATIDLMAVQVDIV